MRLQTPLLNRFDPKQVKFLTLNVMALFGFLTAVVAILVAQDQTQVLFELGQGIIQSPILGFLSTVISFVL